MSYIKLNLYSKIISILFITGISVNVIACTAELDIEGNGQLKKIEVPFSYYQRQPDDRYSFISQGGFKALNIKDNPNEVVVVGPLRPCIGVIVTDGVNLVAMHKHSSNSLDSMKKIISENINLSDKENLRACIHTSKDDEEWFNNCRSEMHNGLSHTGEIKRIKDFLNDLGIERQRIPAKLFPLRNAKGQLKYADKTLGRYELVETVVAIRLNEVFNNDKQIKLVSIDPFTEDVYNLTGTMITMGQWAHSKLDDLPAGTDLNRELFLYEHIPAIIKHSTGSLDGYRYQRGVYGFHAQQIEDQYYKDFFKGSIDPKAFKENSYSTFSLYPI